MYSRNTQQNEIASQASEATLSNEVDLVEFQDYPSLSTISWTSDVDFTGCSNAGRRTSIATEVDSDKVGNDENGNDSNLQVDPSMTIIAPGYLIPTSVVDLILLTNERVPCKVANAIFYHFADQQANCHKDWQLRIGVADFLLKHCNVRNLLGKAIANNFGNCLKRKEKYQQQKRQRLSSLED